jgi:WD40 repeat protein
MNKKGLWFLGLFAVIITVIIIFMLQRRAAEIVQSNAGDIAVLNIKRVDFSESINSYLAWIPGEQNRIAAISEGFSKGDKIYSYALETGATKELYDLEDYGLERGSQSGFFWSIDGKHIVIGSGGVIDLKKNSGYWLGTPEGSKVEDIDVLALSSDGNDLFVHIWRKGFFFMNMNSGKYQQFQMNPNVFFPPLYPLAWSSDGNWVAVATYDPDHPPKTIAEEVPEALYLLRVNGQESRLIARNIEGRIDSVSFSSDGSKFIWVEARKGEQYIYIANIDGSGAHEIFSNANLPSEYNIPTTSNLLWSLDGNRIVFAGPPDKHFNYHFWVLTLGKASPTTSNP